MYVSFCISDVKTMNMMNKTLEKWLKSPEFGKNPRFGSLWGIFSGTRSVVTFILGLCTIQPAYN